MKLPRRLQLVILATCGFVTSFGAHIVATNLPSYAEIVGVGAFTIGVLIAVYDFAEVFAKPLAGLLGADCRVVDDGRPSHRQCHDQAEESPQRER